MTTRAAHHLHTFRSVFVYSAKCDDFAGADALKFFCDFAQIAVGDGELHFFYSFLWCFVLRAVSAQRMTSVAR